MNDSTLNITCVQAAIIWEDKEANLQHYTQLIEATEDKKEIVVLPEMFATGFSMQAEALAETMGGSIVTWMRHMAQQHKIILCGSVIIHEDGKYYNRLVWMQPDGKYYHYDKRHLFAFAGEDKHYKAGEKRVIVQVKGWKINLQICYDLRFPVWARNNNEEYDVLLYVANWPERRINAWQTLLKARAIENQSYVIGVNRVGNDGNNIYYNGCSTIADPLGNTLWEQKDKEAVVTIQLSKHELTQYRAQLPFLRDGDKFIIT